MRPWGVAVAEAWAQGERMVTGTGEVQWPRAWEGSHGALSCCHGGFKTTSPLWPSDAFNKQDILRTERGWPVSSGEHCPSYFLLAARANRRPAPPPSEGLRENSTAATKWKEAMARVLETSSFQVNSEDRQTPADSKRLPGPGTKVRVTPLG